VAVAFAIVVAIVAAIVGIEMVVVGMVGLVVVLVVDTLLDKPAVIEGGEAGVVVLTVVSVCDGRDGRVLISASSLSSSRYA
jgi:hypothetical protein